MIMLEVHVVPQEDCKCFQKFKKNLIVLGGRSSPSRIVKHIQNKRIIGKT